MKLTSSSCNSYGKIRLVTTCHLQTCYNLLKQLAASLFDNQLATSLLTTSNRLVDNKLSQARQTHPDIGLFTTSLLQDVMTNLWQRARFCVCMSKYLKT